MDREKENIRMKKIIESNEQELSKSEVYQEDIKRELESVSRLLYEKDCQLKSSEMELEKVKMSLRALEEK